MSGVIPVYNGEAYVGQAIESLLAQSFQDLEVIVVDDGSTDRTVQVVQAIATRDSRVQLYRRPHRGVVESRNFGGQRAAGEYLAWLDADDIALPERVSAQVAVLDAQPQVAVVGGAITATDAQLRPILLVRYPTGDAAIRELLQSANPLAGPAVMMRTAAFLEVGGCRGAFAGAEDYDLWLRIAERYRFANLDAMLVLYRAHAGQMSQTRSIRMILSTIAAQVAARRRRAGLPEGLDGRDGVSYELLRELEPDHQFLDDALLMTAAVHASLIATVADPAGALELLDWAEATARGRRFSRNARARAAIARGIAAWRMRDLLHAALAGLTSIAANPLYVGRIVGRAIRSSASLVMQNRRTKRARRRSAAFGSPVAISRRD